jgi:hypothetical protein
MPLAAPVLMTIPAGSATAATIDAPVPAKADTLPAGRPFSPGFTRWLSDVVSLNGVRQPAVPPRLAIDGMVAAPKAAALPLAEMSARLVSAIAVDDNDLRALAEARARQVRDHFIQYGKIGSDRLFLVQHAGAPAPERQKPRVYLTLL